MWGLCGIKLQVLFERFSIRNVELLLSREALKILSSFVSKQDYSLKQLTVH